MKIIRNLLILASAVAFLPISAAHAARTAPMVTLENVAATSVDGKPLTAEQVKKAIISGAASKQWIASVEGPNTIRATHTRGRHSAVVDIVYTANSYSIRYVNSVDLNYGGRDGGQIIHPTYNNWVNNLRQAIDAALRAV
jgi:hypothetical protein